MIHTNSANFRPSRRAATVLGAAGVLLASLLASASPAEAVVSPRPVATPTFNGTVWATAYAGSVIYVGGDFTAAYVDGRAVPRERVAAINARTGALLAWAPRANGQVRTIAVADRSVFLGGQFSAVNGVRRDSLARVDAGSGALDPGFQHSVLGQPFTMAVGNGRLYVGGTLREIDGEPRLGLAAFGIATGALDGRWRPTANDQVESLVATASRIYVGGKFHKINGVRGTRRLAAVTVASGQVVGGFRTDAQYITYGMAVTGTGVYAAHGGPGGRVSAYTLGGARRWTITMDGDPQAIAVLGGTVYIGGHFDNICRSPRTGSQGVCVDGSIPRVKLAAANDRGQLLNWAAHGNGVTGVHTVAASASLGTFAAGGSFTTINDAVQRRFAQFG